MVARMLRTAGVYRQFPSSFAVHYPMSPLEFSPSFWRSTRFPTDSRLGWVGVPLAVSKQTRKSRSSQSQLLSASLGSSQRLPASPSASPLLPAHTHSAAPGLLFCSFPSLVLDGLQCEYPRLVASPAIRVRQDDSQRWRRRFFAGGGEKAAPCSQQTGSGG